MRLIPGVLTSPSVITTIDSNQDSVFSESEKRAYADPIPTGAKPMWFQTNADATLAFLNACL